MTEEPRNSDARTEMRIRAGSGDMPDLKGKGLEPLRMEAPGVHGGLDPISFAPGLEPIDDELLRGGQVVTSRPVGEQGGLDAARKRAHELGLLG